ncbi:MAG: helix-turn-helix transcriptional regulator [Pseudomonadota bacterium]
MRRILLDNPQIGTPVRDLWFTGAVRRTLGSDQIVDNFDNRGMSPRDPRKPTPHEQAVLKLLASGMSNRQVAQALGTTSSSVRRSVRNLRIKMHAKTDFQLGGLAVLYRAIEPEAFRS